MADQIKFIHYQHPDGTFDSICPECCLTVAIQVRTAELQVRERAHRCDPRILRSLQAAVMDPPPRKHSV